ncbi:MAG: hypothetical protein C0424_05615 [Sphingobacteriaceae bacterium]|nr:hypothetical protein [Sphingobacteriaceae bacterium]
MVNGYRLSLFCILLFTLTDVTNAQRLNNQWRFGNSGGIDFNGAVPIGAPGAATTSGEGQTAVSDPVTGQLLFYTNGVTVWNRNNQVMLNGNGLAGGDPNSLSSTTAAMICPRPGSSTQYYIFTIDEIFSVNALGLRFSLVDMSLAGGLGGIVAGQKNIFLFQADAEKLQIIPHSNGNSLWVLTHTFPNIFAAFLVDATGVAATPVLSTLGNSNFGSGYLKINRQFTQLAMGNLSEEDIELFDFNRSTGLVSNFRRWDFVFGPPFLAYGLEFSPDGTKLYASNLANVYQYNLQAGNLAAIGASGTLVGGNAFTQLASLQLGPDHRIYVATNTNVTDRIDCPNALGPASNYVNNPIPGAGGGGYGLHNWVYQAGDLPLTGNNVIVLTDTCFENGSRVELRDTSKINQVRWNFGDPASGASNQRIGFSLSHNFSTPGNYIITALLDKNCGPPDTLRLNVTIIRCGQNGLTRIELLGDSCDLSRPLQFRAVGNSSATRFFWQFNDPASSSDTLSTTAANSLVSHQFSGRGTYRICVDYAEPGQATRQLCRTIQVGNCCSYAIIVPESCIDEPLAINLRGTAADSVRWIFNRTDTLLAGNVPFEPNVPVAGNYTLVAVVYSSNCDIDTLEGNFVRKDCALDHCRLFAPTAFTPQGDGTNDGFKPVLSCSTEFYDLRLYNRWGQEVFRTTNPDAAWNGQFNGQPAAQGAYQYVLYFRLALGETRLSSGSLILLR